MSDREWPEKIYLVLQFLISMFFMLGSKWFPVWPVAVSSLVCLLFAVAGVVKTRSADQEG